MSASAVVSLALLALGVVFFLINRTTRLGVVARGTFREAVRQPLFVGMILIGLGLFVLYAFLPFFTLGDDTKIFVDSCMATILIAGLLLAVWTASQTVSEEREGKTVVTLLSKPLTRVEFILGKFLGILEAVHLQIVALGALLLPVLYYKIPYDRREGGGGRMDYFERTDFGGRLADPIDFFNLEIIGQVVEVIPILGMIFLSSAMMAAVAVTLSTRLPALVTQIACFALFILGNLLPTLMQSAIGDQVFLKFIAQLFSAVVPGFWAYDTFTAVSTGRDIPLTHLGTVALYSVCYIAVMMFVAFLLFEDEDLA